MSLGVVTAALLGVMPVGLLASSPDNLARATAIFLNQNIDPEKILISEIKRGMTSVKWTATTGNGVYACSADDMVRRPYCVKRDETKDGSAQPRT